MDAFSTATIIRLTNKTADAPAPHPKLGDLFVRSVDTLHGSEIDLRVTDGWNDQPPLLPPNKGGWRRRERPEDQAQLKVMLRKGVPPVLRCAVWLSNIVATAHPHQPPEYSQEYRTLAKVRALDMAYENLLKRTLSNPDDSLDDANTWKDLKIPNFGNDLNNYQNNVSLAVKRVLFGLDQVIGVIEYSPILPTLCGLLLSHMSESYTFCAMREMAHAPTWYFPTYQREYAAWVNAFCDILERLHPTTANFYRSKGVWNVPGMAPIFRDFFTALLPKECVLRILDIYTLEGSRVIFRFGVALLVLFKMDQSANSKRRYFGSYEETLDSNQNLSQIELVETNNKQKRAKEEDNNPDVWKALKLWACDERFNFEFLVKKAYGIHGTRQPRRFPRQTIMTRIIKMEEERLLDDASLDSTNERLPLHWGCLIPFAIPSLIEMSTLTTRSHRSQC